MSRPFLNFTNQKFLYVGWLFIGLTGIGFMFLISGRDNSRMDESRLDTYSNTRERLVDIKGQMALYRDSVRDFERSPLGRERGFVWVKKLDSLEEQRVYQQVLLDRATGNFSYK